MFEIWHRLLCFSNIWKWVFCMDNWGFCSNESALSIKWSKSEMDKYAFWTYESENKSGLFVKGSKLDIEYWVFRSFENAHLVWIIGFFMPTKDCCSLNFWNGTLTTALFELMKVSFLYGNWFFHSNEMCCPSNVQIRHQQLSFFELVKVSFFYWHLGFYLEEKCFVRQMFEIGHRQLCFSKVWSEFLVWATRLFGWIKVYCLSNVWNQSSSTRFFKHMNVSSLYRQLGFSFK